MTKFCSLSLKLFTLLLVLFWTISVKPENACAQNLLDQHITLSLKDVKLAEALNDIGNKGGFHFSYSGKLLSRDSLVTISSVRQPLYSVLEQLFHGKYEFEEQHGYLIISSASAHLSIIGTDMTNDRNLYSISGVVVDEATGERLMNVSVYAKEQLAATLTDDHGYFKLKFRADERATVNITASKLHYKDGALNFLRSVAIASRTQISVYNKAAQTNNGVERDAFGRFFLSARQRIQSLNIPDFFASQPFQFSLTPGLSTHGLMSSQVVNAFSVNLAGGYTAGVNGIEIGGLFNINKGNSRYLQLAGIFNLVGGTVTGLQLAGVNNRALDSVKGLQLSGFINKAYGQVSGLQISALNNEAHKLKGVQIGLVNVADSSYGASIGLVNIIRNGFYRISLATGNPTNTNISLATGTHQFYSILHLSANIEGAEKLYAFGLGIGHDFMLNNRFYVAASADYQFAYTGSFDDRWVQAKMLLNVQTGKKISVFAGPVFNRYTSNGSFDGYKSRFRNSENYADWHKVVQNWMGWEAGITFNSVFSPAPKIEYEPESWYLGAAATSGLGFGHPYGLVTGGELFLERRFNGGLSAILSAGFINSGLRAYIPAILEYGNVVPYQMKIYKFNALQAIPVKAGMKTYAGRRLFFSGQIGILAGLNPETYTELLIDGNTQTESSPAKFGLLYSVSMGYSLKGGIEPGLMYQDCLDSNIRHIALRLAYRLRLGK